MVAAEKRAPEKSISVVGIRKSRRDLAKSFIASHAKSVSGKSIPWRSHAYGARKDALTWQLRIRRNGVESKSSRSRREPYFPTTSDDTGALHFAFHLRRAPISPLRVPVEHFRAFHARATLTALTGEFFRRRTRESKGETLARISWRLLDVITTLSRAHKGTLRAPSLFARGTVMRSFHFCARMRERAPFWRAVFECWNCAVLYSKYWKLMFFYAKKSTVIVFLCSTLNLG